MESLEEDGVIKGSENEASVPKWTGLSTQSVYIYNFMIARFI